MRSSLSETLNDGSLGVKRRHAYSSLLLHKSFSSLILFKFELSLYPFNMFLLGIKFSWKKTKKDEGNELFQEKRRCRDSLNCLFNLPLYFFT
jgi:hypothetical protein